MALPPPQPASTALVTGASSGIGEQIARGLARPRPRRHPRRPPRGPAARARRRARVGAHDVRAEVDRRRPRRSAARATRSRRRSTELGLDVEVLVNNAGYGGFGAVRRAGARTRARDDPAERRGARRPRVALPRRAWSSAAVAPSSTSPRPPPSSRSPTTRPTRRPRRSSSATARRSTRSCAAAGVTLTTVCPGPVKTEFAEVAGIGGAEERTPVVRLARRRSRSRRPRSTGPRADKRVVVPGLLNRATSIMGQHAARAGSRCR